ncbi:sodium- and chloride-dependent glycine transporter 1-like [Pectinophora gossypiella]|uniref:sodium- and chloride-dependent glycine transporter 1-like n=1 Tax=Pectinophora gossypiella TaxID=13191 RepID=UPI00214E3F7A|nr:sodium- and chloride-dependent glycine transporter 1-like [Pectinophora gossypiella]
MAGAPHERWANPVEYLLSCLGYAVGIGNLWRFPYLCYRNGGGAFLIPYFLTMFICGIPLVYLETTLGQFASAGCISVFNINPLFKGAGYAVIVLNVVCVIYFAAIMAYPVLYIYHSFSSPLPWKTCDNPWNTEKCTEITGNSSFFQSNGSITTPEDEFFHIRLLRVSAGIHEIGGIVWPVFWCNVICWIIVYLCICNGVKSVGKIVYFTVLFPYVVLCVLLVRGVTLPGAWQGIKYYILPDWGQLMKPKVWLDAATQIFFSLGPGWGGLVSMASFNKFHYNNLRSSIIIPFVNCGTSIWAGFVVFSVLGFAADRAGVPVGEVATAGPGLAFVTYPAAVTMMPAPNLWAVTFFVMLFFLGIDTMFVTIEAVIAGVLDEFPVLRVRKRLVTLATCLALFGLSIICNTEGGLHVIGLLDSHVAIAAVPCVCLLEIIAAVYTYGPRKLSADVLFMTGQPLNRAWLCLWRYVLPVILSVIALCTLSQASGVAGWCIALISVVCIPIHAGKMIYQARGPLLDRIKECSQANSEWCPSEPEIRQQWLATTHTKDVPLHYTRS